MVGRLHAFVIDEAAPSKKSAKPKAWLKARPNGCPKCRHSPGCTPSCWATRGGPPK